MYCLVSAFFGSVRMRTKSSSVERLELDADGEAALQLGDQVAGLGDVEGARGDEEDVVGLHRAVLGADRRALDDGQQVALHALAGDVGAARAALAAGDLVDLVEEDDADVLDALERLAHDLVHVDQLLGLLLQRMLARLGDADLAPLGLLRAPACPASMSLRLTSISSMPCAGEDLDMGRACSADLELDLAVVELAGAQLLRAASRACAASDRGSRLA